MGSQCGLIWTVSQRIQHWLLQELEVGSWGYALAMFGATRGHRREVETPSLMADMYNFSSEEEMSYMKAYLEVPWKLPVETG